MWVSNDDVYSTTIFRGATNRNIDEKPGARDARRTVVEEDTIKPLAQHNGREGRGKFSTVRAPRKINIPTGGGGGGGLEEPSDNF